MSSNIRLEWFRILEHPTNPAVKIRRPQPHKYSITLPEGKIPAMRDRVLNDTGFCSGVTRMQMCVRGAGAHPTHPNMLVDVREWIRNENQHDHEWKEIFYEDLTPFPDLKDMVDRGDHLQTVMEELSDTNTEIEDSLPGTIGKLNEGESSGNPYIKVPQNEFRLMRAVTQELSQAFLPYVRENRPNLISKPASRKLQNLLLKLAIERHKRMPKKKKAPLDSEKTLDKS